MNLNKKKIYNSLWKVFQIIYWFQLIKRIKTNKFKTKFFNRKNIIKRIHKLMKILFNQKTHLILKILIIFRNKKIIQFQKLNALHQI